MATRKFIPLAPLSVEDIQRFWSRVNKQGANDCWPWTAGCSKDDYGAFRIAGITFGAHRIAYFIETGIDPGAQQVCHKCDNPPCCNPKHHFLGGSRENVRDAVNKGRWPIGVRHHNAKLTVENVLEIIRRFESGETQTALGLEYGIAQTGISLIVRRKAWKHASQN